MFKSISYQSNSSFSLFLVQLWTTSNYEWFLKQNLRYNEYETISNVVWDTDNSVLLHVLFHTGCYKTFEWIKTVNSSVQVSSQTNVIISNNLSILASIKASMLYISFLHPSYSLVWCAIKN